jgi:hypothetical protein
MQEMNFDSILLQEVLVKVAGTSYVLVEASGEEAARWRSNLATCLRVNAKSGDVGQTTGMGEVDLNFLANCLYCTMVDGTQDRSRKLVGIGVIKSWPDRITKRLVAKLKEISDIDQPASKRDVTERMDVLKEQLAKLEADDPKPQ